MLYLDVSVVGIRIRQAFQKNKNLHICMYVCMYVYCISFLSSVTLVTFKLLFKFIICRTMKRWVSRLYMYICVIY